MSNRTALVTGGAQGIGRGIAAALAAQGFRVAIADLNFETATQTAKDLSEAGGTVIADRWPGAQLFEVPDAAHEPHRTHPAEVARAVAQFLDRKLPGPGSRAPLARPPGP